MNKFKAYILKIIRTSWQLANAAWSNLRANLTQYLQYGVLLFLAGLAYSVFIPIILPTILSGINGIDKHITYGLLMALSFIAIWKSRTICRYAWWRLKPRMQSETFQYLIYTAFISTGGFWFGIPNQTNISVLWVELGIVTVSAVVLGLYVLIAAVYELMNKLETSTDDYNVLIDKPHEDEPLMSQTQTVSAIRNLLNGAFTQEGIGALSIAIDGAWGDGKSSIVKMSLKPPVNKDYVVVYFEPWRYTSQEALVSGFYSKIGEEIEEQLPGFQMSRIDMAKFAQSFIAKMDESGILKLFLESVKGKTDNYAQKVNRHLKRHDKKLLVIIDDIDRLHDDSHVLRTLQLAQYLKSDIDRSVILFVAEMDRITNAIPKRLQKFFMQKFFDITLTAPQPTADELKRFINDHLKRMSQGDTVKIDIDAYALTLLRNLRGVKRILSMLISDIGNVGNNVSEKDIFFLRLMYYVYPVIYADIRDNSSFYYEYDQSFDGRDFGIYGFDEDVFADDQKRHFEDLFKGMDIQDIQIKHLKNMLENHFPYLKNVFSSVSKQSIDYRQLIAERRIGDRDHLDRYFTYNENLDRRHETESATRDFLIKRYLKADLTKRTKRMITYVKNNNNDDTKLALLNLISAAEDIQKGLGDEDRVLLYRDILRTGFNQIGYLVRDNDGSLTRIIGVIDRLIKVDNYDAIFSDIESYMKHPSIGVRLLLYINPDRSNSFHNLRSYKGYDELRKRILKRVDSFYLNDKHDPFKEGSSEEHEWRFILYQWATSVAYDRTEAVDNHRRTIVNDYIVSLVKDDPIKLHEFIMGAFWQHDLDKDVYRFVFNISPQAYEVDRYASIARDMINNDWLNLSLKDEKERDELEVFLSQYDEYEQLQRAADAPSVRVRDSQLKWAQNYAGAGAAFTASITIDNFYGQEDYVINARLFGRSETGESWESKHYLVQNKRIDEPELIEKNRIIDLHIFISDDFTMGRAMPAINNSDVKLEVSFKSGKKRTLVFSSSDVIQN